MSIALSRSNRAAMLNFDIRKEIIVGFALHWTWVWLLFWSSLFYSVKPVFSAGNANDAISSLEPLWNYSFVGMLVTLAALFFVNRKRAPLGAHAPFAIWGGALTAIGTVVVMWQGIGTGALPFDVVYAFGALATGVGSSIEIVLWGEMLTRLGARQTVVYFVAATIVSALL